MKAVTNPGVPPPTARGKGIARQLAESVARIVLAVALFVAAAGWLLAQPVLRGNRPSAVTVAPDRLRGHVVALSETFHPRDWQHGDRLEQCAEYLASHFTNAGAAVQFQAVPAYGRTFRNVIARFGAGRGSKLVVGAHYDAYIGGTPGADDNASGVAALVELGYLLGRESPDREIELVAYVLEEPPFFRTAMMGSAVHAAGLAAGKEEVAGVIVLEMVGRFSDARGSQAYPAPLLRMIYPGRGHFIGVVSRWDQGPWVKRVKAAMKGTTDLPVYSLRAPAQVPGIDLSDHQNYWPYGFHAAMVTDTAPYRNGDYHSPADTADRLDYERMSRVVAAVFEALKSL